MGRLITYGQAAAMAAPAKWLHTPYGRKKFYCQLCSRCDHYYFTNLVIERKIGQGNNLAGVCKSCRIMARGENEIKQARIALALRRKAMNIRW